jgi:hypothetical protein
LFINKALIAFDGGETGIRTLGRLAPTTVFEIEVAGAIRFLLMLVCVVLLKLSLTRAPDNTVQCYLVIISSLANWLAEILHSGAMNL